MKIESGVISLTTNLNMPDGIIFSSGDCANSVGLKIGKIYQFVYEYHELADFTGELIEFGMRYNGNGMLSRPEIYLLAKCVNSGNEGCVAVKDLKAIRLAMDDIVDVA